MSDEVGPAVVELKIPCRPEFVGVARLTVLGVAGRMPFSYDEVEDVRLAVGEACTLAVERGERAAKSDTEIQLTSTITDSRLTIEVKDTAGKMPEPSEVDESSDALDEQGLGPLLMELLVDEFQVDTNEEGTTVRMVKYAG